jgi:GNAT superfamily N-acetyltransferase
MRIRTATRAELDLAVGWAKEEGWDPGRGDADAFWADDPGGFWVGEVDGEIVATISLVRQGPAFGFVGFYIVRPDRRGRGHGHALWRAVVDASSVRTLGLDGVVAQEGAYERSGFVLAHRNARYAGTIAAGAADDRVVDARTVAFDALVAYDAAHAVAARPAFLRAWLGAPGRTARAAVGADGALRGYGALRPTVAGHRIGPLFAEDPRTAATLLGALGGAVDGPVALDVPLANAAAVALVAQAGMRPSFETARMYRGPNPGLPVETIYGVTSLELG